MLTKLFDIASAPSNHITDLMAWKWAFEHPILHTLIQVSGPSLYVVIVLAGASLLRGLFRRRT